MARYRTNKDNEIRNRGQIGGRNKERQKINCFICKSYIPHLMYAFWVQSRWFVIVTQKEQMNMKIIYLQYKVSS